MGAPRLYSINFKSKQSLLKLILLEEEFELRSSQLIPCTVQLSAFLAQQYRTPTPGARSPIVPKPLYLPDQPNAEHQDDARHARHHRRQQRPRVNGEGHSRQRSG